MVKFRRMIACLCVSRFFFFFCQKFYKIVLCVIIFIERKGERVELVKVVKRNENFNILMYIDSKNDSIQVFQE